MCPADYSVEVIDYGNYDQAKSFAVLNAAIDTPTEQQPKVYCIWPMDVESKRLAGELFETHRVPIVQINQLPDDWELDHLVGYAGPKDAERAGNAGELRDRSYVYYVCCLMHVFGCLDLAF